MIMLGIDNICISLLGIVEVNNRPTIIFNVDLKFD